MSTTNGRMSAVDGRASTAGGHLQIQSDLRLEVDGLHATLLADGQQLTFETADAGRLLAQARDVAPSILGSPLPVSSLPAIVRLVARRLDEAGLSARVVTDRGAVIELGRGCGSRLGRSVLAIDHVRIGRSAAVLPVLAEYVRAAWVTPARARSAAAGITIAIVVIGAGRRRRAIRS